jgi:prepilin-type N-terminal cleavage/methylation domain-containing protein
MVKMNSRRPKKLSGFTLLELIIVIAIIAILAAIAVPSTSTMIRHSKINSANTNAEEIYTATQNFVTDAQIKNKKLYNKATGSNDGVFPVNMPSDYKIIFYLTFDGPTITYSSTSTSTAQEDGVINGLKKYLGEGAIGNGSTRGFAAVQVDAQTYTVDWALYSEQDDAKNGVLATVSQSVRYSMKLNDGTAGTTYVCQEYDVTHLPANQRYVGQYPIPYFGNSGTAPAAK